MMTMKNYVVLFLESVQKNRHKAALIDKNGTRCTTYEELDILSGKIAAKLVAKGCGLGDSVIILLGRKMEYIASYLGILRLGGVVVPVVEEYPKERIAYIKADSQAKFIIEDDFFEDIENYEVLESRIADEKAPALIIYTSGSTGNPKGIEHTVESFYDGVSRMAMLFNEEDVMTGASSLSFITVLLEYFAVFSVGGCTHILPDAVRKDVRALKDYYVQHKITIGFISPQMLRLFQCSSPYLKRILTGSERLVNVYSDKYEIYNLYGMSETAGLITYFPVDKKYDNTPIGKAVNGLEVLVLDEDGNEVENDAEGEICVIGHLARGYRNLLQQTQKAFQVLKDGRVLLHTGDCGKYAADGNLIYLNRKDWMVKINGQRVETEEIEAVINGIEGISSAAVKAFTDENGQTYLVAYYVEESTVPVEEIRKALEGKIPEYMIPRFFKKLLAMPINVNGKLDRKSLLPPDASDYKAAYTAPADKLEKAICEGFEEVLKCGRVGMDDDYIRLGGDSIRVLKLAALLSEYRITPNMILCGRTPKEIAKMSSEGKKTTIPHLTETKKSYPLTDAQTGVYLECMNKTSTKMYNIPMIFKLPEKVDVEKFEEAVKTVIRTHKSFHVTVGIEGEKPSMSIHEREPKIVRKQTTDLEQEKREFVQAFDLEQGPLYRVELCEVQKETYFLMDVHHLIFDGTSWSVFMEEIAKAYMGNPIEEEKLTLFDISEYEKTLKETAIYKEAQDFFDKKFDGIEVNSALLYDFYPENPKGSGKKLVVSAHEQLSSVEMEQFTKNAGITENSLFLGAFAYTLAKASGQSECFFCTVNNGRHDERLADATGMFVKTLPIYLTINEKLGAEQFLWDVQKDFYETMRHDCISFGELAAKYKITPNITFVYQAEMLNSSELNGERLFSQPLDTKEAQFDLDVMVLKNNGSYEISLDYRDELYSEDTMRSFANMMLMVIKGMLDKKHLSEIMLIDSEMEELLDSFNHTERGYDRTKTVVDLFRRQASLVPEHLAVVYIDKTYTYAQVDEITERIAGYIKSLGIGREDVVSILIPRCEYMVLASLGVLKAGAAYQPLDSSYPKERIAFMMKDASVRLLIVDECLMELAEGYKGEVLYTKDIPYLPECEKMTDNPLPEDLLIMLYTSGSTGTPKGCMLEHRNLSAFCNWYRNFFGLTTESKVAAYASFGFDADMMDLYPTLTSGGCVHIIEESIRLDLMALNDYFEKNGITNVFMTTQVGRQFALEADSHSLKTLLVGGEKLVPVEPPKNFKLYNMYGPTECTVLISFYHVDKLYHRVPVGKALENVKLYVVDREGRRLPAGMQGELWISGHQVARGYLNRPEQNEKAFIRNPFCQKEGYERIYRTGDIVRFLPDGNIDFVGRNDGQVKIRGFRIELTEVEGVIRQFPKIKDATVADFEATGGGKFLAAYIVSDETIDIDKLNDFILERKPPYMVPAVTMQIDKIPLNQNQKVNKRALPVPVKKADEIIMPKNETQQKIFDCIAKVIGNREFGITTDIYEAGLTSIGAIQLNVILAKTFDAVIRNQDLKENNTVEKLESFLAGSKKAENYEIRSDYPITQTQNGIFVECVANAGTTIYNIPFLFKLGGGVDTDRLKESVKQALIAHPYVEMQLKLNEAGDIRACRNDDTVSVVEVEETEHLPKAEELVKPFTIVGERLYRIKIYRTREGNYLFMDFHHIICDGTSLKILLEDISRAYKGEEPKREIFTGFEAALEEEKLLKTKQYERAKAYYDGIFDGCDTDFLPPADKSSMEPAVMQWEYASDILEESVRTFCEKKKISLNAFFNSVFGFVLSRYSYKEEAVYTTIYNGRNDSRLEQSVAMLVKTFPVYCNTNGEQKIDDYLAETGKQLLESMTNDLYPFSEIARAYNLKADIMFVYQGDEFAFDELCGEKGSSIPLELNTAKAPININVMLRQERVVFFFEYRSDLYEEETMNGMADCLVKTVEEFMEKSYLKEVSMLSKKAEASLHALNATEVQVDSITCNRLFEEQAALHPDKTAVIANKESITYRELNENANRIAHCLMKEGVKPDDMVGVMVPRTIHAYGARQGVLKAGGAFLPIDCKYPDDRISYILSDSKARFMVTTAQLMKERKKLFEDSNVRGLAIEDLLECSEISNPNPSITPKNLCYCIYTSGSTGKPKGVMIEHHSLANFVNHNPYNMQAREFCENMTVTLALAALTFDVSVLEEVLPLYHGATVAMANEEEINNPLLLARMIKENKVDVMKCTPSYMSNMLDAPEAVEALTQMKAIDIGAEAFPAPLYNRMRAANITAKIHNGYGPTEATITTSMDYVESNRITIGKPCSNTKVYMLDKYQNILPPGVPGELTILGDCVGRGYVGKQELTKEKFITFLGMPAYRSGDLARWSHDGKILFMGRMDNQVKLRGLRVELDEIENVINDFSQVIRSVVLVKENKAAGQFLCGYYTAVGQVNQQELTEHLKKSLPHYMIPSVLMQIDAFPMNNNKKVDKKKLPEPIMEGKVHKVREPQTELQKHLCEMFEKVLGIEKVGIDEDFFELGGTSLSASKIAMGAMTEKLPIAFGDIFDNPTVEKLERHVLRQRGNSTSNEEAKVEIEKVEIEVEEDGIGKALSHNRNHFVDEVVYTDIGNMLLTGATGFLGIHVLKTLLVRTQGTVYCLIRKGKAESVSKRLTGMLFYYFNDAMEELMGNRIQVIEGDITQEQLVDKLDKYDFGTVINCAACVKHFVNDDTLDRINVTGVENLIRLCSRTKRRLVQISTVSVAGENVHGRFPEEKKLHENELYFGQGLENKYVNTKFKAEKAVLEAVADHKLDGKIIRVGNLMSRHSDGEFQINFVTNGFMRTLRGYAAIGKFPVSAMDMVKEFSPIDCTAEAIVQLSGTNSEFTVFQACNSHRVQMADVVEAMNHCGLNVEVVSDKEFNRAMEEALRDEQKNMLVSGLVSYLSSDNADTVKYIDYDNTFTIKILYRLGFKWPITDENYLKNAFNALKSLGFFELQ